ncbi:sugar transporter SWEET1-like [Chironomus tepperi]|uniref:sugar transporter SWEET1-like n=1 Tax=Chironomus tepperi TaxID=113505 RepID=UPI00391FA544
MEALIEKLSIVLHPYKDTVGQFAIIITVLQLLTPAVLVNEIRKAKSTKGFSIVPFIGGGIISIMFVVFGQMLNDPVTVKVNLIGVILSAVYISIFYMYTPLNDKFNVWLRIGAAGAFSAVMVAYTKYEDPELVENRFGMIVTLLLYALIASPMTELGEIIRKKSTEGLPFPIIFMGFAVGLTWLVYGIILNSLFMVYQNLVAVLLSGFQLGLFIVYPSKSTIPDKKKN